MNMDDLRAALERSLNAAQNAKEPEPDEIDPAQLDEVQDSE